ncbi:MAG: ABC transporter ATP-binding protein [Alphaproteobacteria bacterium]|nr:ABC transporter ATP-binding protein [Alphaproteobacteria bacterium]
MLPYIKPYAFRAILAVTLCVPIGALDAVIAMSLKPYTDRIMIEKSAQDVWYIPIAILLFAIIQGALIYLATYLNAWVGEKMTRDLKFELYGKLISYDATFFDRTHSGEIIFNFNDQVDVASSQLLTKVKLLISRIFSSISLIGVLIYNSWKLSIIALIVMSCAFVPMAKIRKKIQGTMKKVVDSSAVLVTEYNESYSGNKTISAYNLYQHQKSKFWNILCKVTKGRIKLSQKTAWLSPIMHVIIAVGIGISIAYGSYLIVSEQITSGNFVSFLTALIMLYNPIKNFGNNVKEFQLSLFAIEQVLEKMKLEPNIKDKKNAVTLYEFKSEIQFENVDFSYNNGKRILHSLNLSIKKGETVALVGNSGGGKSTIASLLPRFYDVCHGAIKIDGINIKDYSLESLRSNIAVVFQDNFLFTGTIRDNIMIGNQNASDEDIKNAVKMAYLDDLLNSSDGLDTQIGERGILISGGQKQRIAIARAFLKNAPILILDEATSALDNKSEAIVQKAIANLMKDKTVLVIAHRLSTIQNADKIAVIEAGQVVETGTHEELISAPQGAYKALYDAQFARGNSHYSSNSN